MISKDPLVSNPQIKQKRLGLRVLKGLSMDSIILELFPGNSKIKRRYDRSLCFSTTSTEDQKLNFNLFYGKSEEDKRFTPRFLVTAVRQNFDNETQNYQTGLELMKDTFAQEIEDVFNKTRGDMQ